jgi:hypothetical protein
VEARVDLKEAKRMLGELETRQAEELQKLKDLACAERHKSDHTEDHNNSTSRGRASLMSREHSAPVLGMCVW